MPHIFVGHLGRRAEAEDMTEVISHLRSAGVLTALDAEFAKTLRKLVTDADDNVLLGAAIASRATREGHVCADLAQFAGTPLIDGSGNAVPDFVFPSLDAWRSSLGHSTLVGDGTGATPLVLDARNRLYLARLFEDERRLARALRELVSAGATMNAVGLVGLVERLFGPAPTGEPDLQRIGAQISAVSRLTVITGGPGTGKTTTVAKILALALSEARARGKRRPRALLLAPTGKAAARLAESTARAKSSLDCPKEILALIPDTAQTLHRALGASRPGRPLRRDAERPLYADVIVVDEASMVDVTMMRCLVEAVPKTARLVLLGDHRQLSSVEAGAVLADICGDVTAPRYSRQLVDRIARTFGEKVPAALVGDGSPGISDSVVLFRRSYRFGKTLGALADAVERGDANAVLGLLESGEEGLLLLEPKGERGVHPKLADALVEGFRPFASASTIGDALRRAEAFRVLCAHRRGPLGVEDMNEIVGRLLVDRGVGTGSRSPARLVMVTKNDASVGLFNGDVGVAFRESADDPIRIHFSKPGAHGARALASARVPAHEPAFAISVHKSQGSEFDEAVVVLPPLGSPLLVRELFYTAVTRARKRLIVHASSAAIRQAVERRMERASGLEEALRAP
jgi:exodeoxyribonuclease V alpha subunit